jgi:hypothetical protein
VRAKADDTHNAGTPQLLEDLYYTAYQAPDPAQTFRVNYATETLEYAQGVSTTNLTAQAGGQTVAANGSITSMADGGGDVSVRVEGAADAHQGATSSVWATLHLAARRPAPSAGDLTITPADSPNEPNGTLSLNGGQTFEYRIKGSTGPWELAPGGQATGVAYGTYEVRYPATTAAVASFALSDVEVGVTHLTYQVFWSADGDAVTMLGATEQGQSGSLAIGAMVSAGATINFAASFQAQAGQFYEVRWNADGAEQVRQGQVTSATTWNDTLSVTDVQANLRVRLTVEVFDQRTVTYDANGGSGTVPATSNTPSDPDYQVTLSLGATLSRAGYDLSGWNTRADGKGTSYALGATYTLASASDKLYAVWTKNTPSVYTPKYSAITVSPDMNGDGRGEVLTITATTGALTRHAPDVAVSKLSAVKLVDGGLVGSRVFGPGDWDGDKKADVVTVDTSGVMWLRQGNGKGGVGSAPGSAIQIGRGWSAYRIVPSGDLDSDGVNDMLAVDNAGGLWLYAGNGKGGFKKGRIQVGHGWTGFDCYAAGDLNRDGRTDILGVNPNGLLYAYLGRGNGTFQMPVEVGHGWRLFALAAGGDLNGDGLADIIGRNDSTGQLYYYQSKGGGKFAAAKQIASGW